MMQKRSLIDEMNAIHEVDLPEHYDKLTSEQKAILCGWIDCNLLPRRTVNRNYSSYGLKHLFEESALGFYITNGQFKGAMLECGFDPYDEDDKNWCFGISEKSPAFRIRR